MTNLSREILRMASKGISQRSMATALSCSRHQVAKTLQRAAELNLAWPLPEETTDDILQDMLFPVRQSSSGYTEPDYEYIDREMRKSGVTLTLLWAEYCKPVEQRRETVHVHTVLSSLSKTSDKSKATMHLDRLRETIEVDGQVAAKIVNPETVRSYRPVVRSIHVLQSIHISGLSQTGSTAWIQAHVHLFNFLGGVPKVIVPELRAFGRLVQP